MAVEELSKLHDQYFGRYKGAEYVQAAREKKIEKQNAAKKKYEVQPPQIIHKQQPITAAGSQRQKPSSSCLNVLLGEGQQLLRTNRHSNG